MGSLVSDGDKAAEVNHRPSELAVSSSFTIWAFVVRRLPLTQRQVFNHDRPAVAKFHTSSSLLAPSSRSPKKSPKKASVVSAVLPNGWEEMRILATSSSICHGLKAQIVANGAQSYITIQDAEETEVSPAGVFKKNELHALGKISLKHAVLAEAFVSACVVASHLSAFNWSDESVLIVGDQSCVGKLACQFLKLHGITATPFSSATPAAEFSHLLICADTAVNTDTQSWKSQVETACGMLSRTGWLFHMFSVSSTQTHPALQCFPSQTELKTRDINTPKVVQKALKLLESGVDSLDGFAPQLSATNVQNSKDIWAAGITHPRIPNVPKLGRLSSRKTYIVLGGTKGFGFASAVRFVMAGARHIVIASRSIPTGSAALGIQQLSTWLKECNGSLVAIPVDVCQWAQMETLISTLQTMPPVGGVALTAMVLMDRILVNLQLHEYWRTCAPKVYGVLNLQRMFQRISTVSLDFVLFYSSVAASLGNLGQAAYSAGNHYMDIGARILQGQGIPAISVCWGAIGEVGVLQREAGVEALLNRAGFVPIPPYDGLRALSRGCSAINADDWSKFFPSRVLPLSIFTETSDFFSTDLQNEAIIGVNEIHPILMNLRVFFGIDGERGTANGALIASQSRGAEFSRLAPETEQKQEKAAVNSGGLSGMDFESEGHLKIAYDLCKSVTKARVTLLTKYVEFVFRETTGNEAVSGASFVELGLDSANGQMMQSGLSFAVGIPKIVSILDLMDLDTGVAELVLILDRALSGDDGSTALEELERRATEAAQNSKEEGGLGALSKRVGQVFKLGQQVQLPLLCTPDSLVSQVCEEIKSITPLFVPFNALSTSEPQSAVNEKSISKEAQKIAFVVPSSIDDFSPLFGMLAVQAVSADSNFTMMGLKHLPDHPMESDKVSQKDLGRMYASHIRSFLKHMSEARNNGILDVDVVLVGYSVSAVLASHVSFYLSHSASLGEVLIRNSSGQPCVSMCIGGVMLLDPVLGSVVNSDQALFWKQAKTTASRGAAQFLAYKAKVQAKQAKAKINLQRVESAAAVLCDENCSEEQQSKALMQIAKALNEPSFPDQRNQLAKSIYVSLKRVNDEAFPVLNVPIVVVLPTDRSFNRPLPSYASRRALKQYLTSLTTSNHAILDVDGDHNSMLYLSGVQSIIEALAGLFCFTRVHRPNVSYRQTGGNNFNRTVTSGGSFSITQMEEDIMYRYVEENLYRATVTERPRAQTEKPPVVSSLADSFMPVSEMDSLLKKKQSQVEESNQQDQDLGISITEQNINGPILGRGQRFSSMSQQFEIKRDASQSVAGFLKVQESSSTSFWDMYAPYVLPTTRPSVGGLHATTETM